MSKLKNESLEEYANEVAESLQTVNVKRYNELKSDSRIQNLMKWESFVVADRISEILETIR